MTKEKMFNILFIILIIVCIVGYIVYLNWDEIVVPEEDKIKEVQVIKTNNGNEIIIKDNRNLSSEEVALENIIDPIQVISISLIAWTIMVFLIVGVFRIMVGAPDNSSTDNETEFEDSSEERDYLECQNCDSEYSEDESNAKYPKKFCSKKCERKYLE